MRAGRWEGRSISFILVWCGGCWWVGLVVVPRVFAGIASPPSSCKPEVPREASSAGSGERGIFLFIFVSIGPVLVFRPPGDHVLKRNEVCVQDVSSRRRRPRTNCSPSRHNGHELERSNNHGSTQVWWNLCLPSQGSTRRSSPSSKSTIQMGHVSRPMV
jgi:hypothetical protein